MINKTPKKTQTGLYMKKSNPKKKTKKGVAFKLSVNGEIKDVTFEQLSLMNNLDLTALVRLLVEKKIIKMDELVAMVGVIGVKKDCY